MRTEELPLLSQLPPGLTVQRCEFCRCLALQREVCANAKEAARCIELNGPTADVVRN